MLLLPQLSSMYSWSSHSMVSGRNNSSGNSGSSLNLNSLDLRRGSSNNMVSNWGSISISSSWNNSRGSLNLNSLDLSNSRSSNMNGRGSNSMVSSNWSSINSNGSNWSSIDSNCSSRS